MPPNHIGSRRAGESGRERFRELRWRALKRNWRDWVVLGALTLAALLALIFFDGVPQLVAAFVLGVAGMMAVVGWVIGGDVWSLPPAWGAIGEQQTGEVLESLDEQWWIEHDIPSDYGNDDHILIGPPGIFLLDSKRLSRTAIVQNDELRAGSMRYSGRGFRRAAVRLGQA